MHCLTPLVLMALRGEPCGEPGCAAFDPRMIARPDATAVPPAKGRRDQGKPRGRQAPERRAFDGKALNGTPLDHHLESTNFSVQWSGDDGTEAYALSLLDALEEGWQHLVEEDSWPAPVSSDLYLLTVVLDPTLGGSGFTTVYGPNGYPVSYVNPGYGESDYPGYSLSAAVHEFGHMIQFGVRDFSAQAAETWYWEASAEWMADRGVPDIDTYALSTWWYATATTLAYDSAESGHDYGMLLLPRYIEDTSGQETVRDSWVENGGATWDDAIGDAAGAPIGDLIVEMAGAYAAGALTESALFYAPDPYAPAEGEQVEGGLYGTEYVQVAEGEAAAFSVEGPAAARYAAGGVWSDVPLESACVAAITRTGDGTISWGPRVRGDSGDSADRGDSSDSGQESGPGEQGPSVACSCAAAQTARGSGAWIALFALAGASRRRAGR